MGLFHKREEHTAYPPESRGYGANHHSRGTSHSPKRGLFHKREEHTAYPPESSGYGANHHHSPGTSHSPKRGLFHRGGSSPSSSDEEYGARRSSRGSHGGGLFHRHDRNREDPSIAAARKTLASAEESERAAGMAVNQARGAVAEAREHVKRLEGEAREESKLAKLKRTTAKDLGKRSKPLGRKPRKPIVLKKEPPFKTVLLSDGTVKKTRHPAASKKNNALLLIEIDVYSRLPENHLRFPRVIECDRDVENPSITIEYMPNGTLNNYMNRNRDVSLHQRALWVSDVLEAVNVLHCREIYHPDIRPSNFVVDPDLRLCLINFTGASIDGKPPAFMERPGFFLGRDVEREGSNTASDLFAVGSTIYQIMTGMPPYGGRDDDEIDLTFAKGEHPFLEGITFKEVISCCWRTRYTWTRQAVVDVEKEVRRVFGGHGSS